MPPTIDASPSGIDPQHRSHWDGKLRVEKKAVLSNPEALSDPDYSDEDAPPVDRIQADEGMMVQTMSLHTWIK